jgi:predicted amidohydrolase
MALADVLGGIAAAAAQGAGIAVFPECAYPGYVLLGAHPYRNIPGADDALRAVSEAARRAGIAVAVGIARCDARGGLCNEAVFFDRRGAEAARYAKIFLWNFDSKWFVPGDAIPVFETEFGRIGMMICADGRMPEIARTMARKKAWLVLDPTAWVAYGPSYDRMRNPQVEFMMRVRARENGLWIAAADKCGTENASVHYVGKSMIVAPDGTAIAVGPPDRPAMVVADVERQRAKPFTVPVLAPQRRALIRGRIRRAPKKSPALRLGVLQGPVRTDRATAHRTLDAAGADAIVDTSASPAGLRAALRAARTVRFAAVSGSRMLAPEPARAAALDGADLVVWAAPPHDDFVRDYARTRAVENKVYVLVCARVSDTMPACVIDPGGNVIGEALQGTPSGFIATIEPNAARDKIVVPGTDVFAARLPKAFELFGSRRSK